MSCLMGGTEVCGETGGCNRFVVARWDQYRLIYVFPPLKLPPCLLCKMQVGEIPVILVVPD